MSKINDIITSLKINGLAKTESNHDLLKGYALANVSGMYSHGFGSKRTTTNAGMVAVEVWRVGSSGRWTTNVRDITCKP